MGRGRRGTWALSQTRIWALNGHFKMLYVGTYAVFACSPSPLLPPSIPLTRAAHPSPCRYRAAPIVFPHSPLGSTTAATVQRPWRSLHRPPRGGAIVVASIHCDGGDGSSRSGSHGGRVPRADLIGSVVRAFRGRRVGLVALSRRPGRPLSRRRRWATVAVAAAAMAAATVAGTAAVGERGDMQHLWAPPATEASSMVTAAAVAAVPAPVAALTPGHHGDFRASIASPDGCHMDGTPAAQAAVLAVTAGDPAPVIGRASRRAARFLAVYAAAAETATATTTLLDDRRAPAAADALPTAIRRWPPRRPMIGTGGCSPFTRGHGTVVGAGATATAAAAGAMEEAAAVAAAAAATAAAAAAVASRQRWASKTCPTGSAGQPWRAARGRLGGCSSRRRLSGSPPPRTGRGRTADAGVGGGRGGHCHCRGRGHRRALKVDSI